MLKSPAFWVITGVLFCGAIAVCASDVSPTSSAPVPAMAQQPLSVLVPAVSRAPAEAVVPQGIQDSRALVAEEWATLQQTITGVQLASECKIVDPSFARLAIQRTEVVMLRQQADAGLIGDKTMTPGSFIAQAVEAGKRRAESGACESIPPADRARLRMEINAMATG